METGDDRMRRGGATTEGGPRQEPVRRVTPFRVPDAQGGWPCACCDELFPVRESWKVELRTRSVLVVCPACADEIQRRQAVQRTPRRRSPRNRAGEQGRRRRASDRA